MTTAQQDSVQRANAARQARATSQQRIRVQKGEAAGTLDLRADSIANAERVRADSVNRAMLYTRD